jgi:glutathione S-transferase
VPVLEDGGQVVFDSMEIVRHLEDRYPQRPLYPKSAARRAEMLIFIDWFNRVWKRPPNEIESEMGKASPDRARIERLGKAMTGALDLFERMLDRREHLMGDDFSAADCCAFPFLKYALLRPPQDDTYLFHRILVEWQPLGGGHPRLADWIRRVDQRPRA